MYLSPSASLSQSWSMSGSISVIVKFPRPGFAALRTA
jgi:hypothetical protein